MGWKLKALAFIAALAAIPFGAWIITLPLLIYAFSGLIFRRSARQQKPVVVQVIAQADQVSRPGDRQSGSQSRAHGHIPPSQVAMGRGFSRSSRFGRRARLATGGIVLLLALVALSLGGRLSVASFGAIGTALILWGRLSSRLSTGRVVPVRESILLRSFFVPFRWAAFATVKLTTKQVGKALAAMSGTVIVLASKDVEVLIPFRCWSLTCGGAEKKVLERMKDVNMASAPLGAYLLPLDSQQASGMLDVTLERLKMEEKGADIAHSLASLPYDTVVVASEQGYAERVGLFRRVDATGSKRGSRRSGKVPEARAKLERPPLLWEVIVCLGEKVAWPGPDSHCAFLTSIFATRDLAIGERLTEVEGSGDPGTLAVKSIGSPTVELSRPQLRAVMEVYGRPAR